MKYKSNHPFFVCFHRFEESKFWSWMNKKCLRFVDYCILVVWMAQTLGS